MLRRTVHGKNNVNKNENVRGTDTKKTSSVGAVVQLGVIIRVSLICDIQKLHDQGERCFL